MIFELIALSLLQLQISAYTCEFSGSSREANPLSCRKFFLCKNKVGEEQECGDTQTFDVTFRQCRATELVDTCDYAPKDCYINQGSGFDYQGILAVAGKEPCLDWSKSIYSFSRYKIEKNYCRNPTPGSSTVYSKPWCLTNNVENPVQNCDIPMCTASSINFKNGYLSFNTGSGNANSTSYDLEASYEEQIMFYLRTTNTDKSSTLFELKSQTDDQVYRVKLYKKTITVFAWLEAGSTPAKANEWVDLADGKAHKIVVTRKENQVFLKVDDGSVHFSALSGLTDKLMLPMKVEIGKNFQGCLSSFDIITKNYQGKYRHHEPFEKMSGKTSDNQMLVSKVGDFGDNSTGGCMLTPRFSETPIAFTSAPDEPTPTDPPNNGGEAVSVSQSKDIYIILGCVIGAALIILLVVLIIVCRNRNKDKGVYKLKETKQFDWEYGNLPPSQKNGLGKESEHGV